MILDELAAHARERVAADKAKISLEDMKAQAEALTQGDFRFEKALAGKDCAFICEVKKASPSKGVIDPVFDFEKIAQSYEDAGADCVSCLTEPKWFLGSDEIFKKVRGIVTRPMIRKDFTVDDLRGGSPKANAQITRDILSGKEQGAKREEILLNAGIALYLGLDGLTLADGIKKAAEMIDSGAALAKLDRFAAATQEAAKA